ncbi:hypothetical protein NWE48_23620 [Escherichia coli]|nr:hypothetical protein [Escherichia coli]
MRSVMRCRADGQRVGLNNGATVALTKPQSRTAAEISVTSQTAGVGAVTVGISNSSQSGT